MGGTTCFLDPALETASHGDLKLVIQLTTNIHVSTPYVQLLTGELGGFLPGPAVHVLCARFEDMLSAAAGKQ